MPSMSGQIVIADGKNQITVQVGGAKCPSKPHEIAAYVRDQLYGELLKTAKFVAQDDNHLIDKAQELAGEVSRLHGEVEALKGAKVEAKAEAKAHK